MTTNHRSIMFSIIVLITYITLSFGHASKFNETDRQALLAVKDAITMDPNGVLKSWNTSVHHCQWKGIFCSLKHPGRVTILNLSSQGLAGRLSPHAGNLSFLRIISLQNNSFYGEIPMEIGNLFRLRLLYLNNNSFSGVFTTNLTGCKNLKRIYLSVNMLTGKIPAQVSSLPNLCALILGSNKFNGKIPPSLGNISSLAWLHVGGAMLEGNIPEELGRLRRLETLVLHRNYLTGEIPSSIFNLSRLVSISVGGNSLEGNLPKDIGNTSPHLEELFLRQNKFTGSIPISLSNCSNLQTIDLLNNSFTGSVPNELGRLANLSWINLTANKLGGTSGGNDLILITYLTNCTRLRYLLLGENLLEGSLPNSISNLSSTVEYIQLGSNRIYGAIPSGIGNLVKLNGLELQDMMLEGNIPHTIGNPQNMFELRLYRNNLTGLIPSTLDNLTFLYHLDLSFNKLTGNIPSSVGKCPQLRTLYLSQNNLSGNMPLSLFALPSVVFINLSHNSLIGLLPPDVGNLKQVESLDISYNKLSGGIPSSLGSCISLIKLRMNANLFNGSIPENLGALRGLDELDLSGNNLSRTIPEFLGSLPFLQILNLSFNDFEGEVPRIGVFKNANAISLSGNENVCGGIPELNLKACTKPDSKKNRLPLALKVSIPLVAGLVFLALLAGFFILQYRKNKKERPLFAILKNPFIRVSYQDLLLATNGFSAANLIGFGSYGSVYRGFLEQSQSFIAVKVFKLHRRGASKNFLSECKALRNIRHRNLLKILSVCSSVDYQGNEFKAVVYAFMARGSLEGWLHLQEAAENKQQLATLNLMQRLNIDIDVASALEYLHCHCQQPIVHGDLKPSNVLLDDDMVAYVGDFGLAKVLSKACSNTQDDQSSSIIKGTIGYVAPEYGMGEGASIQGDVYSFGILLLEVFTGRRPTDAMFQGDLNLHSFTRMSLAARVMDVVDQKLLPARCREEKKVQDCLASLLRIGVSCSVEMPKDRIEIRDVVRELHLIKKAYEKQDIHPT